VRRLFANGPALAVLLTCLGGWSFFDPFHARVEKGNRAAKDGDVLSAVEEYGKASRERPESPVPDFNTGVVQARKGDAEAAKNALLAASASDDVPIAADALYNLGNVMLEAKQPDQAVEAYLKSLDLDPHDADARRNLEIALRRLEQQQQQQQQGPQDQEQQQPQQPKDEEKPENEEPQDQQQPQPEQPGPDSTETQPQPDKLSREDAERLLNAIRGDEMKVLQQLQEKNPGPEVPGNDW
jgi:tetratricopeptide (TPR) repeat protein